MEQSGAGQSNVFFVGQHSAETREALRLAGVRAQYGTVFADDPVDAQKRLGDKNARPRCVLVDTTQNGARELVAWVRGEGSLFAVPVIATVSRVADEIYNQAHALGADDVVVGTDFGGVTRRLANLGA